MVIDKIEGTVCLIDRDPTYIYGFKKLTQLKKLCEEVIDFQDHNKAIVYLNGQRELGKMPYVILIDIHILDHIGAELHATFGEINSHLGKNIAIYAVGTLITNIDSERAKKYTYITDCILKPTTEHQLMEILGSAA